MLQGGGFYGLGRAEKCSKIVGPAALTKGSFGQIWGRFFPNKAGSGGSFPHFGTTSAAAKQLEVALTFPPTPHQNVESPRLAPGGLRSPVAPTSGWLDALGRGQFNREIARSGPRLARFLALGWTVNPAGGSPRRRPKVEGAGSFDGKVLFPWRGV